jgi:hypothetical protein
MKVSGNQNQNQNQNQIENQNQNQNQNHLNYKILLDYFDICITHNHSVVFFF